MRSTRWRARGQGDRDHVVTEDGDLRAHARSPCATVAPACRRPRSNRRSIRSSPPRTRARGWGWGCRSPTTSSAISTARWRSANHPEGGAVFTVTLRRVERPERDGRPIAGWRRNERRHAPETPARSFSSMTRRTCARPRRRRCRWRRSTCSSAPAAEAPAASGTEFPGVLVTDIRMPGTDGTALMRAALERDAEMPVILVTGHGDVDLAVQSMRDGRL
jgi:CheY-like chemotaxis protein